MTIKSYNVLIFLMIAELARIAYGIPHEERKTYYVPRSVTDKVTRPFLPGFYIPGNKKFSHVPDILAGVALPGQQHKRLKVNRAPFQPFDHQLGTSFLSKDLDSWGYGLGIQGVNLLGLDVARNYPFYANLAPIQTDGTYRPFNFDLSTGMEYDVTKKWKAFHGDLNIPILGLGRLFDLAGDIQQKKGGKAVNRGQIDFPLLYNNERFPLSGTYKSAPIDPQVTFGHAIPNVNLFRVPSTHVVDQLARGREANPAWLG